MLPNQVGFVPCTASQNSETPRFTAKREFLHKAKQRRTTVKFAFLKVRSSGYLWITNEAGWSEAWGKVQ